MKPSFKDQWAVIRAMSRDPAISRADIAIAIELFDRMDDDLIAYPGIDRLPVCRGNLDEARSSQSSY